MGTSVLENTPSKHPWVRETPDVFFEAAFVVRTPSGWLLGVERWPGPWEALSDRGRGRTFGHSSQRPGLTFLRESVRFAEPPPVASAFQKSSSRDP